MDSVSISPTSWGSDSSNQGSPVENPFGGSALYPVASQNTSLYGSRASHSDRWSVPTPAYRPDGWSAHSSHSSHHYPSSRRETGHSESWNLSSARWQGETYQPSSPPASSVYVDRSRTRSSNPYPTPLQIPSHRRDSEASAVPTSRYAGSHQSGESREGASRLPWLLAGDSDGTKDGRNHHSGSSVTAQSQPGMYSSQGYHRPMTSHSSYSSGWSSNSSSSLGMAASQTSFSSPSSLHSYGSSYAPSSGGMSSPEEYSNADDSDWRSGSLDVYGFLVAHTPRASTPTCRHRYSLLYFENKCVRL